ncbi:hypothetical protein AB0C42_33965, partial [Micromonospora taraxaci]|uniref:hypothetical protein n=1 Tax=Micromonospora taraxaci TaxID=1316803 RepID=UPI003405B7FE
GTEVREMRKAHRCPDCSSDVTVNRRTGQVDVHHDDTCPMLARLRRSGRTSAIVFMRRDSQTPEQFADQVTVAVAALAARTGQRYQIRTDPYRGMPR